MRDMEQKIQMVDLHGQYMKIKADIDAAIAEVIDSSAYSTRVQGTLFPAATVLMPCR